MPNQHTVQAKWVRDMYVLDAYKRAASVTRELEAEKGTDILTLDWTVDAARRCGGSYLFNAMSSDGILLLSVLTKTPAPSETCAQLASLKQRGVNPLVVYVDDECCGAWPRLLGKVWPGVRVRLDVMHAMRRLTQTTTSTRHPWHGHFCGLLSSAIYQVDGQEDERLARAWRRDGNTSDVPKHIRQKYVARYITNPSLIASEIEEVLAYYTGKKHKDMGELLTPSTHQAWGSLRKHVRSGCLCDPQGMQLNVYGATWILGGEAFKAIKSKRGSSSLEGFHTHQKSWLGASATHSGDAGMTLLRDGALRWNRKRHADAGRTRADAQAIFDDDVSEYLSERSAVAQGRM